MNNESKAWIAGFFDGEGCIYIRRTKNKHYNNGIRFDLVCSISQRTSKELKNLQKYYGGSTSYYEKKGNRRSWWKWSIVANQAVTFLNDIHPFLRIKKVELEYALKFQLAKGLSGKNLTEEQRNYQEKMYLKLRELKR